jgi:mannose-6-phosphate isomerase-like protein (cupin superfamily)
LGSARRGQQASVAVPGEIIENPATGERIEFTATRRTTGGELLAFELTLAACGRVAGFPHKHEQAERFTVHSGTLSCWLGPRRTNVHAGESLVVPPRVTHFVFNDDPENVVRATVEVRPAGEFETFFETYFAIAAKRRYVAFRGLPRPLHMALLAYRYGGYGPLLPIPLQRALLAPLAALARLRGYPEAVDPRPALVEQPDESQLTLA